MLKKFSIQHIKFANLKNFCIFFVSMICILILAIFIKIIIHQHFFSESQSEENLIQVQTIRVKEASMPELIETVGQLTAKEELKLKAGTSGRIQYLLVESGSWVKKGTLLANIIAAPEVYAPFDGYLTDWQVKPGEYVTTGTELIELVNTDFLSITYRVPECYAVRLQIGQPVQIFVKAFHNKIFQGFVNFVSPVVDTKAHTILVRATIKNTNRNLLPGMLAHIRHFLEVHSKALIIPELCLVFGIDGYDVFVIVDSKIQKRAIRIGEKQDGRVHVTSGLNLGEPVVLVHKSLIQEGKKVSCTDWAEDW